MVSDASFVEIAQYTAYNKIEGERYKEATKGVVDKLCQYLPFVAVNIT